MTAGGKGQGGFLRAEGRKTYFKRPLREMESGKENGTRVLTVENTPAREGRGGTVGQSVTLMTQGARLNTGLKRLKNHGHERTLLTRKKTVANVR